MNFTHMLGVQLRTQQDHGIDPRTLDGDALVEYIRWNALALTAELGRMLDETHWEPWIKHDGAVIPDQDRYLMRLICAFRFVLNLTLAGTGDVLTTEIARRFVDGFDYRHEAEMRAMLADESEYIAPKSARIPL